MNSTDVIVWRENRGLTQEAFARLTMFPVSTILAIETDQCLVPRNLERFLTED